MEPGGTLVYWAYMENLVSGHGVYSTEYHVVWIPKYQRKILNPGLAAYLEKLFLVFSVWRSNMPRIKHTKIKPP